MPSAEVIDQVERSFLCPTTNKDDLERLPLLHEFDNEMKIYQVRSLRTCVSLSLDT